MIAMELIKVDPRTDIHWQQLISQQESVVFHSPSWIHAVMKTYGWQPEAYVLLDENRQPLAGVPFCVIEDMRGKRAVCFPFSDACDPIVQTAEQWAMLRGALEQLGVPVVVRCLHNTIPLTGHEHEVGNRAAWHGMDLKRPVDEIWTSLHSSARRAIRKAANDGIVVEVDNSPEAMRTYFDMHLRIRKYKYHLLAQPYALFENILTELIEQDKGFIATAKLDGKIIAANIYLTWQKTLIYKFSASYEQYMNYRPVDAIIWNTVQFGCANGYEYLDFGLSDIDQDGLIGFKRKYATEEKQIQFLRFVPQTHALSAPQQQAGKLLPRLTELFTASEVPDQVTEQAGELLYRFFV